LTREEALGVVRSKVSNERLVKHMLAAEALMKSLAERLGEDVHAWALAGLVHDLDYDETVKEPERHGRLGASYLREMGIDEEIACAVESHAGHIDRRTQMEKALYAADPLTGLIVAATLMHPSKRLKEVSPEFVMNRFNEKRFAAGADRDQIRSCDRLGISLEEFITLGLKAMQDIADDLGL
jgi:putative nucleotidyltransferase with HDIG domain